MSEHTPVSMPAERGSGDHGHSGRLTVTVHNEDTGDTLVFEAGPGEKVKKVIDALYKQLNTSPRDTDRLLCAADGQPVQPHADEHLRDYARTSCPDLEWTFAHDTGGA